MVTVDKRCNSTQLKSLRESEKIVHTSVSSCLAHLNTLDNPLQLATLTL